MTNTHNGGRFRIRKVTFTHPRHDAVLQQIFLEALHGNNPLRVSALLAPHLVNGGSHNTAWIDTYKGHAMLAEGDDTWLAFGASRPFLTCSVGYAGSSDGCQQLCRRGIRGPALAVLR
jgi:glucoamylase